MRAIKMETKTALQIGALLLLACVAAGLSSRLSRANAAERRNAPTSGMLFVMSNQVVTNQVFVYTRSSTGSLTFLNNFSTLGEGTGSDINSQGALLYLPNLNLLYVVNTRSLNITGFSVSPTGLTFISITPCMGSFPSSLTSLGSTLYVLNGGGIPNIQGFTINSNGTLTPISGATGELTGGIGTQPAQVSFSPSGTQIVVTEKKNNVIDVFPYNSDGTVGTPTVNASDGLEPFGFAFDANGFMDVTDSDQLATTSYQLNSDGTMSVISPIVTDFSREPAHIVETTTLSPQIAYVSNAVTDRIASYTVGSNGSLTLANGRAANLAVNSKAIDMVMDSSGTYLYVLTQANGMITGYTIKSTGGLSQVASIGGLPHKGTWGLAGY
jgi:6-phosphogluconolactonase